MYGKEFCKVYNEFGWNYYPESFGEQLLVWLKNNNMAPKNCLDIGCGTGVLCEILEKNGITPSGIDLSEEMIAIAKENSNIHYEVADMVTYKPEENFGLVTCTGDALNHLPDISLVDEMFKNVFSYMAPGAAFVFDILNGAEGREEEPFTLDYSDTVKAIFRITKEGKTITLSVSVYENDIFQFEERIVETYFDPKLLLEMMRNVGFTDLTCSDQLLTGEEGRGTTWFITGRKPL